MLVPRPLCLSLSTTNHCCPHIHSRKNELPGIAQWMVEQRHKRLYAEDVLRLNAEAVAPASTGATPLMCLAL